jgi:hypothetical protein
LKQILSPLTHGSHFKGKHKTDTFHIIQNV